MLPRPLVALAVLALAGSALAQPPAQVCLTPDRAGPWATHAPATIAFADSVHALVVFLRFSDDTALGLEWPITRLVDEAIPRWGRTLVKRYPDKIGAGLDVWDPSLSAYFYHQSAGAPARHVFTGEVWPRDARGNPHVYVPDQPSSAYAAGRGTGYGYLVREVLDALVAQPGFDVSRFDANHDGELDHLMLIVRRDPAVRLVGGVANLSGVTNARVRTGGTPAGALQYEGSEGPITVDMRAFGSGTINWVGGERSVRTILHEYGHVFLDTGHTRMITPPGAAVPSPVSNDVPAGVPEDGTGAYACQYNRMCGGGQTPSGRATESSNYDATLTLSGFELRRLGWARRTVLDPTRDTTVVVRPMYHTSDVVLVPLRPGSGADTLSVENRQRTNPFDAFPPLDYPDPGIGRLFRDLPTEGLLATLSYGDPAGVAYYDHAPPSNQLPPRASRCDGTSDGCGPLYDLYHGAMLEPGTSATQMTPWTRPNVSGYTIYPPGFEPNWFALTDVRYTGADDRSMALDFVADVRTAPPGEEIVLSADSWMGRETGRPGAPFRFTNAVRVTDGATLTVWDGAEIVFGAGVSVDEGAEVICEPGSTCTVEVGPDPTQAR